MTGMKKRYTTGVTLPLWVRIADGFRTSIVVLYFLLVFAAFGLGVILWALAILSFLLGNPFVAPDLWPANWTGSDKVRAILWLIATTLVVIHVIAPPERNNHDAR